MRGSTACMAKRSSASAKPWRLRRCDDAPGDVVRLAERNADDRTNQSARSVAVEKPVPAAAAHGLRDGLHSRRTIPVIARTASAAGVEAEEG